MAKKRARSELVDERKRNNVFKKRMESLTKQAHDLSILCGIDMGIVVHKPGEDNAILWPSPEVFGERMHKFLNFPETERTRKMVLHGEYLEEKINIERGKVEEARKKNKLLESHVLMNEVLTQGKPLEEVDLVQLNDLKSLLDEMLNKLKIRDDELNSNPHM